MQWKNIEEFDGLYEISDTGIVRSLLRDISCGNGRIRRSKLTILRYVIDRYGYVCYTLRGNGKSRTLKAHRLVMQYFVGESDLCVNHKDLNKKNNSLSNLEYVTVRENNIHARENIKFNIYRGERHHCFKLSERDKDEIVKMKKEGESNLVISKKFNIHPHTIYKILNTRRS